MKREIDERVRILVGLPLSAAGRAVDMATFGFGNPVTKVFRGRTVTRPEHALHIQCPWRIVRDGEILVGYADYRWPPTGSTVDYRDFDESDAPRNRRDDLVDLFMAHGATSHIVEAAEGATTGDLRIAFADGCVLEIFANGTSHDDQGNGEQWRLLLLGESTPHFVVMASEIE